MMLKSATCKNCNHQFQGKFCNQCGQSAHVGTITFKDIWHEGWHNVTHTDKGYLHLVRDLAIRPGKTIKNYLSGQRKRYFNPFTFYLVTTSLLILITHLTFAKEDRYIQRDNEFGRYIGENINYLMLCMIPVVSLVTWLLFKNFFKSFAESFVVSLFIFGALNFFLLITTGFFYCFVSLFYHNKEYAILLGYVYIAYILYQLFKPKRALEIIKLLLLVFLIYFLVEVVSKGLFLLINGVPFEKILFS